jgi:hypothetical protein
MSTCKYFREEPREREKERANKENLPDRLDSLLWLLGTDEEVFTAI